MDDEGAKKCVCAGDCGCQCNTAGCANCSASCDCAPKEDVMDEGGETVADEEATETL